MTLQVKIERLRAKYEAALKRGGQARIDKQHQGGKLTARERIAAFLDEGVLRGSGRPDAEPHPRRPDPRRWRGHGLRPGGGPSRGPLRPGLHGRAAASLTQAKKICKIMDMAMKVGCPCIGMNDSGGARIQEGVNSLAGYAEIFLRNTRCCR